MTECISIHYRGAIVTLLQWEGTVAAVSKTVQYLSKDCITLGGSINKLILIPKVFGSCS